MKQILATVSFVAMMHCAVALPNYDPFTDATGSGGTSYTANDPLVTTTAGQTNGENVWIAVGVNNAANGQPNIVADSLTYPDLPASTGNSVSFGPLGGMSARVGLNLGSALPAVYCSFLLKITDISAVPESATGNDFACFSDAVAAPQAGNLVRSGGRLIVKKNGAGFQLGIALNNQTGEYQYDPTVRNVDDTLFVVASYERTGGNTNVNLWVNPSSATFGAIDPPAPTVGQTNSLVNTTCLNGNGARGFVIECRYTTAPSGIIDELRVATNWGYVTGGNPTFPVAISSDPASRNVKVGDRVGFVVGNSGTAPVYQWRFNGTNITDATDSTYAIASAQLTDAGSYTVVVTNVINALTSNPAILTVSETPLRLYETNLVAVRVGDGSQTLANTGNSVFLDQFTTNGTYVNTIFIPDTGGDALIEPGPDLIVPGNVLNGAALTRSADKRLMALSGYNTALGSVGTGLHSTTSAAVPRGIVTIDSNSQTTLAVADTTAYSATQFRGAATDGTNNFWGAGGGTEGTYYLGLNSAEALIQTSFSNTRSVDIFNGNLYCLASLSGANGLIKFNGLPTTDQGAVQNILVGFNSTTTTDFSVDPTDTLIYVTVGNNVQKWDYDASTTGFTNAYSLAIPNGGVRYLTVDYSGASPVIYVDNGDGELFKVVDTGPASTATMIAASGPNQLFKGIRFGPIASASVVRPMLSFVQEGANLILSWSGAFPLLSATNVAGPYAPVSGATSPYTNSTTATTRMFFGLGTP